MKRKITKFLAALALLVFTMPSLVAWGQTRQTITILYSDTFNPTLPTASGSVNSTSTAHIDVTANDFAFKEQGIYKGSSANYIMFAQNKGFLYNTQDLGTINSVAVTYSSGTSTTAKAGVYFGDEEQSTYTTTNNQTIAGTSQTDTWTNSNSGYGFFQFSTSNKNCQVTTIVITYTPSGAAPTVATPVFNPVAGTYTTAQNVAISTATEGATIYYTTDGTDPTTSSSVYSTAIPVSATTTIKAMAVKADYNNSDIASATYTIVEPITGYTIDFEQGASLYTDWNFTNMTSKQTGNSNVTAHGGTYYGITGNGGTTGTATAAITTKTAVATPYTLTCFVTRQSDNTNSSTWYVQVSANGEDWTDVESTSATDMAKGVWKEISVDLSAYTDVYVRVYYDGSTAVRNIDDLTLSTDAPTVLAPTFSPVAGTYTEIQNVTITCATEGATIYYTTDGSTPNDESDEYTEAITVSETTTIKAIAYVGTESSAVATAEYVINLPSVATPTFTPAAGTYTGTQTVTIACETQGASILYKLTENGEWQAYTTALTISETTTVWAKATKTGLNDSEVATATYTIVTPITIAAVREQPTGDVVTTGIITYISGKNAYIQDATAAICVFVNTSNYWTNNSYAVGDEILVSGTLDTYGTGNLLEITSPTVTKLSTSNDLPYASKTIAEINEDNFSDLQCLHVKIENATVQSVSGSNNTIAQGENTILVYSSSMGVSEGDIITSFYANVGYYNGLQLVNPTDVQVQPNTNPSITVTPATVTWDADFHEVCELVISYENYGEQVPNPAVFECNAAGEAEDYDWISAYIVDNTVQYGVLANEGVARTAYLKVYDTEIEGVEFIVTINQEAYEAPSLTGTITFGSGEGSTNINSTSVTGEDSMGNTWTITTVFDGVDPSFTPNSGYAQVGSSKKPASSITFTTTLPEAKTIASFEAKFGGFSGTAGDINLYVGEALVGTGSLDETEDVIVESTETAMGTVLTVTVTDIAKGVKCYYISYTLEEEAPAGYPYSVNGYGSSDGGYVLMATPTVASVDPASVGMITDQLGANVTPEASTYDLYYYDQAQDKEWRNYRAQSFELEPGKGYLYASKDGVTLTFTGELNPTFTDVTLPYTEGNAIKSLYLAGNSSTEAQTFYVYDNDLALQTVNFLTMNSNGDGFTTTTATSLTAEPMQGFFVQAAGSNWTLSTAELSNGNNSNQGVSLININVMRDRGNVIDNAIVSFSEGSMMNKFYLRDNTTRVYIPQGNEEMAVVRSAAEAEMPVSFKAAENGTYTLAIETENVEMNYLHLIDNMTGMDVDLLQTPSYTFEAKTSDYASRFRLVFKASSTSSEADETFAYFNGSSWTVSNLGEATLQVVDVTGRTVANQMINGNAELNLNQPAGVYMLRLVNGNSVKVQKVVVR